jgi:predicted P-loop ATPase
MHKRQQQLPSSDAINRLVDQDVFLLTTYHQEYEKDRTGRERMTWMSVPHSES